MEKIKKIIVQLPLAKSKTQKQEMCANIVALLPDFYETLADMEVKYNKMIVEGVNVMSLSKTEATINVESSDWFKTYRIHKRMAETVDKALPTLQMYVPDNK